MKKEQLMDELMRNWKVPAARSERDAWEALQARIAMIEEQSPVRRLYQRPLTWVAAAAIIVFLAGAFLLTGTTVNQLAAEGVENLVLPDGSSVVVNAGSALTWSDDWSSDRNVSLQGEAFFMVEKGQKFTVTTPEGKVEVLGTSFNVCDENGRYRVDCYSGRVSVRYHDVERVITKGQGVKLRDGVLCEPFEIAQEAPSWKDRVFQYTNADLSYVIDDIAAHYDVEIVIRGSVEGAEFSGDIPDIDATTALALVAKAMGMNSQPLEQGKFTFSAVSDE